jgi:hypothetical protein
MHPLLSHTQLRYPPYYKFGQLNSLLVELYGTKSQTKLFRPIDQTTKRLVTRCIKIPWLCGSESQSSLADAFTTNLHLGVSNPNENVSSTSVHHVAEVRKPPPCISVDFMSANNITGVKTPRRRGKKIVPVEESNGKPVPGENGHT